VSLNKLHVYLGQDHGCLIDCLLSLAFADSEEAHNLASNQQFVKNAVMLMKVCLPQLI
jgi:hypothetical protein